MRVPTWSVPAALLAGVLVVAGSCGRGCGTGPGGPGGGAMRTAGAAEGAQDGSGAPEGQGRTWFRVDLRPDPAQKGVCEIWIGGERIGVLDRLGRRPAVEALRTRATAARGQVPAEVGDDARAFVKASPDLDPQDVSEVMSVVSAAGFRDLAFEGYPLSRRTDRWR